MFNSELCETRFVEITPPVGEITPTSGIEDTISSDTDWKGVFVEGRRVKLSPYKIAEKEVTYALWHSVLKWNTDNSKGYVFANSGK